MSKSLQGSEAILNTSIYDIAISFLKGLKDNISILNFGCGALFSFENHIIDKKKVSFTSMDIVNPKITNPKNVKKFIRQDIEKPLSLESKYDAVTFFELIEHIDHTDELLKNCYNNLKKGGYLVFSFPNLGSLLGRIELLLGYQPHILEVSNDYANFGTGFFGKRNNAQGITLHHIRGITTGAMKELICYHGFTIEKVIGFDYRLKFLNPFPQFTAVNIFICRKN
jgi:SAM-dependent methyltransferase